MQTSLLWYEIIKLMEQNKIKISSKYVDLIELDPEEEAICTIKRHYIGLIGVYLTGALIALGVIFGSSLFGAWLNTQTDLTSNRSVGGYVAFLGLVIGFIVAISTFISGYVYNNSVIIVTSDKLAQILYKNLVDRKISQLSLGDLQDVTVNQVGLLARVFHYGTLTIETAGEQNNFTFNFTPYPYRCAEDIVSAREKSIKKYGN